MLVMAAAVVIAVLCGLGYISGYYDKGPGGTRNGESIP